MELLLYFHNNPDSTDTIDGIAAEIHRKREEIERDITDLVELGLLQEIRIISFDKQKDRELQSDISRRLASPPTEVESGMKTLQDPTGIGVLDNLLPEGYPSPSTVLVMGDPATGKTTLVLQILAEALKKGKQIVYATLDEFPSNVRSSIRLMGIDSEAEKKKLMFIDCYSFLVGVKSEEQYSEDPQRLSDLSIVISKALSESPDPSDVLLVFDSLTTLIQRSGVRPSFDFLHTLVAKVRSCSANCILSLSRKAFHPAIIAAIEDKVEGVIELKAEDTKDGLARFIRIPKMKGTTHSTSWNAYEIDSSLGLLVPQKLKT